MQLLLPEVGLLFWMLLSFLLVFGILAKFGFPVITRMVEKRRVYVSESLENARLANARLAEVETTSEQIMTDARREQMKILDEAAAMRLRMIEEAKNEAHAAGQKQLEEAKRQIRLEKEAAIRDVRTQIAVMSVDIAEKILRSRLGDESEQTALINKMLDEMPALKQN